MMFVLTVMLEFPCFILKALKNRNNLVDNSSQPGVSSCIPFFRALYIYIWQQDMAARSYTGLDVFLI